MLAVDLALRLRAAGLVWQPAERDTFALPEQQLDQQIFVVSQLTALIQLYNGYPVVTFHGSTEWALDYVLLTEAVWMPSETQLRERLEQLIGADAPLRITRTGSGYRCEIGLGEQVLEFDGDDAESAYGIALLHVLGEANDSR